MGKNMSLQTKKTPYKAFFITALLIPTIDMSVGRNWLPALIVTLAAMILTRARCVQHTTNIKWLQKIQKVIVIFLLAWTLDQTHSAWNGKAAEYVIPFILLALGLWSVMRGEERAIRSCNVLRYGIYTVVGIVFISAVREIHPSQWAPKAEKPSMGIIIALLLPLLQKVEREKTEGKVSAAIMMTTLITAGTPQKGIYQYSRGIAINGVTEHIESIVACAMTVGYYCLLCYLLLSESGEKKRLEYIKLGVAAYIVYLLQIPGIEIMCAAGIIIAWIAIPSVIGKEKKVLDK